jgi:hypothetical protein
MSRKQNTDNEQRDGRTDRHAESSIPPTLLRGYNESSITPPFIVGSIIGQGSPYNMHISKIWSFSVPSFISIPQKGLGGVKKTTYFSNKYTKSRDHNSLKSIWNGFPLQYAHFHNMTLKSLCQVSSKSA